MREINDAILSGIDFSFEMNCEQTIDLLELCSILHLSLEDDDYAIFRILNHHVWTEGQDIYNIDKIQWRVDKTGYEILCRYATRKENVLSEFRDNFIEDYYDELEEEWWKEFKKKNQRKNKKRE